MGYQTSHQINFGKRILPIKMIETFSDEDWERFIEEWLDLKKEYYLQIERFGGAGDKGRDVVGYLNDKSQSDYSWNCYQCKHYDTPLQPTQIYVEIGKILYYTFNNEYPKPVKYYFVAPKGCGTTLSKFLQDPDLFKNKVIQNWDKYCKYEITKKEKEIKLDGEFLKYVEEFDFSIFSKINVKDIIKEHTAHPNHLIWFGGGLPERPKLNEDSIPTEIQSSEITYVTQLLLAYASESKVNYGLPSDLDNKSSYLSHFSRSRISFHHAEQLRNFSRDSLPPNTFYDFQKEIHDGIVDIIEETHENGFVKVKEVEKEARKLQITSNPLKDVSIINDRSGICHQLVNDGKFKWIENEQNSL